jgi:hypothetical protein
MIFNDHHKLKGLHAPLGGSNYHWIRYDDEKLVRVFSNMFAKERGTRLHDFAAECILLRQRLPAAKKTLNMYVNDAIGFGMSPEVVLFYSENIYGTADAISYMNNVLRIHDLKTGDTPAHMEQLQVYAALFCLEYKKDPKSLERIVLSIYQNNDILSMEADPTDIKYIMDKAVNFDKILGNLKEENEYV